MTQNRVEQEFFDSRERAIASVISTPERLLFRVLSAACGTVART
jgi:hypothetical protein